MDSFADRDRIILAALAFYGYHGVMMEENALGQRFRIDLELGLDMSEAARTDEVAHTISYAHIYDLVKEAFEERREILGHELQAGGTDQRAADHGNVVRRVELVAHIVGVNEDGAPVGRPLEGPAIASQEPHGEEIRGAWDSADPRLHPQGSLHLPLGFHPFHPAGRLHRSL